MSESLTTVNVVEALRAIGLPISSVWDLVNSKEAYPTAVPVLLRLLPMEMDPVLKEGIVRALTVKEARGIAAQPLIDEFRKVADPDSSLKWAIGNALSVAADDTVFDQIADLVLDKRNGRGRQMLVSALGLMTNPRAIDVAITLLHDDHVAGHAVVALRKLKPAKARSHLKPFLDSPYGWIRKEAKRALERIDAKSDR